jgi:hypothetical protein
MKKPGGRSGLDVVLQKDFVYVFSGSVILSLGILSVMRMLCLYDTIDATTRDVLNVFSCIYQFERLVFKVWFLLCLQARSKHIDRRRFSFEVGESLQRLYSMKTHG